MLRAWLALAVLLCGAARGQAPSYSTAGIVNAISYGPGPFAPNSVVTIFGSNLAYVSNPNQVYTNTSTSVLPTSLDSVSVYVDNYPAPLLMVSQGQINFIIPSTAIAGTSQIVVVRQSIPGPSVSVPVAATAPTLFPSSTAGYVIAEDWNNSGAVIGPDSPAHAGDTVIVFATGLGALSVSFDAISIPGIAAPIANLSDIKVLLNGAPLDPSLVKYAGVTPGCAGLYQINLVLPANTGTDPTIQVTLGGQSSQANLKLLVR